MGTRERKLRERTAREMLFIETAQDLIRHDGLLNLQMSRLADACDYATGTLYQHFASKEDLLLAIATQDMKRRAAAFARIPELPLGTRDRMLAVILTDIDFGQRHPDYFRLIQYVSTEVIWDSASPERRQQLLEEGTPISLAVARIVAEAVETGDLPRPPWLRPVEIAAGPWCLNTGMHTLIHAHGLLEAYAVREPYDLLLYHSHALLNGLGWQPLADLDNPDALARRNEQVRGLLDRNPVSEPPAPPN
ncbi:Transcriptional regulator, TetR family [Thioalkalivibrio nitratireducens DSM 14787]|uniref:Transcriptional regulator, TetR family n=1 Tax=Thioalkalivibrio nitratireducens (strain DSM 14787 / UNIQEM 213 / ALEN2) TaxID=1255043 RepID=L0DX11_THIND|nr:TetR/AcrR family transcriptional regulator [Thioalkalivibrio nitratireducens]AGA32876.1 Transcriptional regulator, TetR family [Thioalkalivibrio nitratireducens DSM 14787]